ncbi:MAG: site-2 protease family protein [Nanoarchaeota archaeon]
MNFITLDLTLLVLILVFVGLFLYKNNKNLKREGLMYLYKTSWGLKLIESTSKKYERILRPLQILVIISGFILMITMFILLIQTLVLYMTQPADSPITKIPAVFPLIPYFPKLFNLDSIFPPFYFIYFILAILVVAVSHEFSHGIFARLNKIKILSTGFAFLGPFMGAFVEQDDKQMWKSKKFPQMAILAAGTFANVVMTILFAIVLVLFFKLAFVPAGFVFNTYAYTQINSSDISSVNNQSLQEFLSINESNLSMVQLKTSDNLTYFVTPSTIYYSLSNNLSSLIVFEDTPAARAGLIGAITEIDLTKVTNIAEVKSALARHSPGETIQIKTLTSKDTENTYEITLASTTEGNAYLGIGSLPYSERKGVMGKVMNIIFSFKDPNTYYAPILGDMSKFIYDLIWWVVIINLLVALFNMYPAGILDGGRFFLLTIWGITGKKKYGEIALKVTTWFLLAIVAVMMLRWVFAIF